MTTINPTPSAPASTRPGRWISVLLIVLGSIGLVFGVTGGVVRGFASHGATDQSWTADAEGVRELRIESSASRFELLFADVDEATLVAESDGGPVQRWNLERRGDTLVVGTDWRWDWVGFGRLFDDGIGDERATLTVPEELQAGGLDLDADISAGSFTADADLALARIDLSAGEFDLAGSAEQLELHVSAGDGRVEIDSASSVVLDVSAGRISGALTGKQPDSIVASVSAGDIDMMIPDGEYAVTEDASAGSSDVDVVSDSRAAATIDVDVSAGSVTLRGVSR
ncbi:hypothetical protein [Agrococcus beijingensis]|uniref:hypothetical protein n=1 Tax=Agrococcus beijingensis TaxID=3068634 RepID=UPI002740EB54|nr:hypothetical protein [Agrococcus sp. REN33]